MGKTTLRRSEFKPVKPPTSIEETRENLGIERHFIVNLPLTLIRVLDVT